MIQALVKLDPKVGVENNQNLAFKKTTKAADIINTFGTTIHQNPSMKNISGVEYFRI